MKPCKRPVPLKPGDRLWVTLPSGALRGTGTFEQGVELWRSRGLRGTGRLQGFITAGQALKMAYRLPIV